MIIGLTGSLAAGKGVVSNFLREKGFVYLSLSDELRVIAKEKKIEVTRESLQNLGNQLRENFGSGILAQRIYDKIANQEYKKAIVDGIRNPAEVELIQKHGGILVEVHSAQKTRFERVAKRAEKVGRIFLNHLLMLN